MGLFGRVALERLLFAVLGIIHFATRFHYGCVGVAGSALSGYIESVSTGRKHSSTINNPEYGQSGE